VETLTIFSFQGAVAPEY